MKNLKILFFLGASILVSTLSAQVVQVNANTLEIGTIQLEDVNKVNFENAEGSPYLTKDYIPAKINDIEKTHFVRLNALNHTLEVKVSSKKIVVLDTKNDFIIQFLDGSNRRFVTASYPIDNSGYQKAILELVSEKDPFTLYKRERKKFVKAEKRSSYKENKSDQYVGLPAIYYVTNISKPANKLIEIPKKKKNFFVIFKNQSKKISAFVKQEKLSISNENDLKLILDYFFEISK